jgi:hypothetical protein
MSTELKKELHAGVLSANKVHGEHGDLIETDLMMIHDEAAGKFSIEGVAGALLSMNRLPLRPIRRACLCVCVCCECERESKWHFSKSFSTRGGPKRQPTNFPKF